MSSLPRLDADGNRAHARRAVESYRHATAVIERQARIVRNLRIRYECEAAIAALAPELSEDQVTRIVTAISDRLLAAAEDVGRS